jgi:hypothetical protein
MKAVEWAEKFNAAVASDQWPAVLEEYGKETAELVALRSKSSDFKTKLSAMTGAVNEQRNKFRAVIGRVYGLTPEHFEALLPTHAKEYLDLKDKAEKKPEAAKEETTNEDGRKLANAAGKKHPPRNRFGGKSS